MSELIRSLRDIQQHPGSTEKYNLGTIHISGRVDASDPSYHIDVWCRHNNLEMVEGDYQCEVIISDEGEWGFRVAAIGIYLSDDPEADNRLASMTDVIDDDIGVDSGTCGFFVNKYELATRGEWNEFCDFFDEGIAWVTSEGFFSSSGYGDGGYPLYGHKDPATGKWDALQIKFL